MKTKPELKNRLCGQFKNLLAVRTSVPLLCFVALGLTLSMPARAETPPTPIPVSGIGAKATADYHGDALGITATSDGARLRCGFQKLEGHATAEGLWLESTAPGAAGKLRLTASAIGRTGLSTLNNGLVSEAQSRLVGKPSIVLPAMGTVSVADKLVRFTRPGVSEEYFVSVDGVRQDFIISAPPAGAGDLRVELALRGARAEAVASGSRLTLEGSGRMLAYSHLRVEDATGRELTAHLEVLSADRLVVSVADAKATYPVRIDPTFSDADWVSVGSGMDDWISALVVGGTNLYAGGSFSTAGAVPANCIAKWDGSAWSALGSGMDGTVMALAVGGTNLYVGGVFGVAKWDGNTWSALGEWPNASVTALAVSGTNLYAGGSFRWVGGVPANSIAKWDGSTWSPLGSGINGSVRALAVSGANLYVGGDFNLTTTGGVPANCIAKWDGSMWSGLGSAWQALGSGMNEYGYVSAMTVSGTNLYVGGQFTNAGGVAANCIAKWDGNAWSALGSGIGGVFALAVSGTNLYAAGWFTTAGGVTANHIAKWDGSAWSALGSGMDGTVTALAADELGHLFVGGGFTVAGTSLSPFIAQANLEGGGTPLGSNAPVIVTPPQTQTAEVGSTAYFTVSAIGTPPVSYHWFFNSTAAIADATNSVLQLNDVQFSQSGSYTVVVTNLFGEVTSSPAILTVTPTTVVRNCSESDLRAAMAKGGTVMFACDGTIWLSGTITNVTNVVLDGSGHQIAISGSSSVRVFDVATNTSLELINLTICNGQTHDGTNGIWYPTYVTDGGPGEPGGGIYNAGTLTLCDCVVTANRTGNGGAGNGGPGVYPAGGSGGSGGGIYNAGTLTLSNCIVSGNSTGNGGVSGGFTWYPAGGDGGFGGGIYNSGLLRLDNSTVSGNSTGNGVDNPIRGPGSNGGAGGGIWSGGNLTANSCTFNGNSTGYGGHGGMSDLYGGGGGAGGSGGAISGAGWLALTNCTFAGNSTGNGGFGGGSPMYPGHDGAAGSGSGICSQSNLDLVNCTIVTNRAGSGGTGLRTVGFGGGITNASGTVRLLNSIIALNAGNSPDVSGAFFSLGHNLIGATNGSSGFPMSGDLVGSSAFPLDPNLGPLANNGGPTLTMALSPGSSAIDAGDTAAAPPTDQRGYPRPAGWAADIGAYEYWPLQTMLQSQTAEMGCTVDLVASPVGSPLLFYQWFFNGNALVDCTNSVLCLSTVQVTNVGSYSVIVSNLFGAVTSSPAVLNVVPAVERRPVPAVNLVAEAGSSVNVEYTDALGSLANWLPLDTVSLTNPPEYCFDTSAPLPPQRFYRAWQSGTPAVLPSLNLPCMVPAITLTGNIGDSLRLDYINAIGPTDAWVTLDTVTLTNTSQLYFDTSPLSQPARLYRITPVP